jgi:hypothetical protein
LGQNIFLSFCFSKMFQHVTAKWSQHLFFHLISCSYVHISVHTLHIWRILSLPTQSVSFL